jgi:hypothetical protein
MANTENDNKVLNFGKRYDELMTTQAYDDEFWKKQAELKADLAAFFCQKTGKDYFFKYKSIIPYLSKESIITICRLESLLQFIEYHKFLQYF